MRRERRGKFGSIRKHSSENYQASCQGPDGRPIGSGTFSGHIEADLALADVPIRLHRGTWIERRQPAVTVEHVAQTWLAINPHKRQNTYASDRIDVEKYIIPALGNWMLPNVRPVDVQCVVNIWSECAAPRTVARRYGTLRAVFNFAVNNDWLTRSPIRGIKLPKVTSTRSYPLKDEEVAAIAQATAPSYRAMVWLGALTGCRWSEAAGLRVGDLNMLAHTMRVEQVVVRDEQGRSVLCSPKSDASRRVVALPEALVQILADYLSRAGLTAGDRNSLVFTAPEGGILSRDNWRRRVWIPALKAAGLATARPRPGFHDLRRAVATALVGAGVDPKTVQTRLGHADVRTILEIYSRVTTDSDRLAAELLADQFLGEA